MIYSQILPTLKRAIIVFLFSFILTGCIEVTYVDPSNELEDISSDINASSNLSLPTLEKQENINASSNKLFSLSTSTLRPTNYLDRPLQCKKENKKQGKHWAYQKKSHKSYLFDMSTGHEKVKSMAKKLTTLIISNNPRAITSDTTPEVDENVTKEDGAPEEPLIDDNKVDLSNNSESSAETNEETINEDITDVDEDVSSPTEDVAENDPLEETIEQPPEPLDARFPDQYFCHNETVLTAESMSLSILEKLCEELKTIEDKFHQEMQTNYQVVDRDMNDLVEIHIFDSYFSYLNKIKSVSGLTYTSNGGFFYEGSASKEGNRAKIYVFEKTFSNGVWNLTHEYVHHLNARYIKYGNVTNKPYYLFWEEGIAEYFSQRPGFSDANFALLNQFSIKDVLAVDENSNQTAIYGWSYWLMRYLIVHENDLLYQLSYHLQQGEFTAYETLLDEMSADYDESFQEWLKNQ